MSQPPSLDDVPGLRPANGQSTATSTRSASAASTAWMSFGDLLRSGSTSVNPVDLFLQPPPNRTLRGGSQSDDMTPRPPPRATPRGTSTTAPDAPMQAWAAAPRAQAPRNESLMSPANARNPTGAEIPAGAASEQPRAPASSQDQGPAMRSQPPRENAAPAARGQGDEPPEDESPFSSEEEEVDVESEPEPPRRNRTAARKRRPTARMSVGGRPRTSQPQSDAVRRRVEPASVPSQTQLDAVMLAIRSLEQRVANSQAQREPPIPPSDQNMVQPPRPYPQMAPAEYPRIGLPQRHPVRLYDLTQERREAREAIQPALLSGSISREGEPYSPFSALDGWDLSTEARKTAEARMRFIRELQTALNEATVTGSLRIPHKMASKLTSKNSTLAIDKFYASAFKTYAADTISWNPDMAASNPDPQVVASSWARAFRSILGTELEAYRVTDSFNTAYRAALQLLLDLPCPTAYEDCLPYTMRCGIVQEADRFNLRQLQRSGVITFTFSQKEIEGFYASVVGAQGAGNFVTNVTNPAKFCPYHGCQRLHDAWSCPSMNKFVEFDPALANLLTTSSILSEYRNGPTTPILKNEGTATTKVIILSSDFAQGKHYGPWRREYNTSWKQTRYTHQEPPSTGLSSPSVPTVTPGGKAVANPAETQDTKPNHSRSEGVYRARGKKRGNRGGRGRGRIMNRNEDKDEGPTDDHRVVSDE